MAVGDISDPIAFVRRGDPGRSGGVRHYARGQASRDEDTGLVEGDPLRP